MRSSSSALGNTTSRTSPSGSRARFIVITGFSGSGKSSLAFDTIYAEGQRRYVESLSSYARQFLGQMDEPDVDSIGASAHHMSRGVQYSALRFSRPGEGAGRGRGERSIGRDI